MLAHLSEIDIFLSQRSPSVLVLTETRITADIEDYEIKMPNYNIVRADSSSRHTGGVMCYIRDGIKYDVKETIIVDGNYWMLSIVLKKVNTKLACVYHSPSGSHADFIKFFEDWCEESILNFEGRLCVVGDFNLNWLSNCTYPNKFRVSINDLGLKQLIKDATRVTKDSRTIIDLVLTNDVNISAKVLDKPNITDHSIVEIVVKIVKEDKVSTFRGKIKDLNNFRDRIKNLGVDYRMKDINIKYNNFYNGVIEIFNIFRPMSRAKGRISNKWWNDEVLNAINERDVNYKKYKLVSSNDNWNLYKHSRNNVVNNIRKAKLMYYEREIDECKGDSKTMWKTLKTLISNKGVESVDKVQFGQDKIVTDKTEIANEFNKYFIDSINKVVSAIPSTNSVFEVQQRNEYLKSFKLLDRKEVYDIVSSMVNKSSPDEVDIGFIKQFWTELEDPIIHIINCSLEGGEVPNLLKVSTIIPLKKVKGTIKENEFRPINMLSAIDKILERIVYQQLNQFITANNILDKFQSGFRVGSNCEAAVQYVLNDWKECTDKGMNVAIVLLDLQRAFETISREILLHKLRKYGFADTVLKWVQNYLKDRKQKVKCEDGISVERDIEVGVPQGSILGPLLFLLYINDLGKWLDKCKYHMFADDTIVYLSMENQNELVNQVNKELTVLNDWFNANKLKVNINKTKCLWVGKERPSNLNIKIDKDKIQEVETAKYLGVFIDNKLNFKPHIDYVCKKISKKLGVLARVGKHLTIWSRKVIYNTIVFPHFIYCGTILHLANQESLNRLQKLQNRAMRIVLKMDKYTSIGRMLGVLEWLNVRQLLEYQVLVFIKKIELKMVPEYLSDSLVRIRDVHNYNTRGNSKYFVEGKLKKNSQIGIFYRGIRAFNDLSDELRHCVALKKFKYMLRKDLRRIS